MLFHLKLLGGRNSDYLQKVVLPVLNNDICKEAYARSYRIPIDKYHLCAGFVSKGGKGTCIVSDGLYMSISSGYLKFYDLLFAVSSIYVSFLL